MLPPLDRLRSFYSLLLTLLACKNVHFVVLSSNNLRFPIQHGLVYYHVKFCMAQITGLVVHLYCLTNSKRNCNLWFKDALIVEMWLMWRVVSIGDAKNPTHWNQTVLEYEVMVGSCCPRSSDVWGKKWVYHISSYCVFSLAIITLFFRGPRILLQSWLA